MLPLFIKHNENQTNSIVILMKRNLRRFIYPAILMVFAGLMFASCSKYPTYTVNTSDMDMVWTNYNETTDFTQYKTYFVPDSILLDSTLSASDKAKYQEYYESVLATLNTNMEARNFVRVDSSANPDLGLGVSIITRENYVFSYNYWYGYPGYWGYPGYGYYYPWATYLGSYEEGALIVDMSDLKNIDHSNKQIHALWAFMIGGILTNNSGFVDKRLYGYIDQAFVQSPYMVTNP